MARAAATESGQASYATSCAVAGADVIEQLSADDGRTTVTSAAPSSQASSPWWPAPPGQAAASVAAPGPTSAQDVGPASGAGSDARTQPTSNRSSW
ncbi:hypothetical protein [Streptomyces sp. NK08204]|uniref:hypothetical protein n=1 Tax=Streptomyces sp. NK08204 TaxID=2873260 RepID=UPI001CEC8347|nr:hypothetical protein [Streptomyces sp. NK08204]